MPDVTVKSIDDMEAIYGGLARRARAELGVTAWGMQGFTLPPDWGGYPNHNHGSEAVDPNQEDEAARVERPRPLRATRAAHHLAAHHRHKRLPHRHLATACAARRAD